MFDVLGLVLAMAFYVLTVVCLIAFVTVLLTLGRPSGGPPKGAARMAVVRGA